MKRRWIILGIVALTVLCAFIWVYWESEMSLAAQVPDEQWTSVDLYDCAPAVTERKVEGVEPEAIIEAIAQTAVTRGPEFSKMTQPYFELRLQPHNGAHTLIYVLDDGRIAVTVEMDTENYRFFEGGEEFYAALQALAN